MKCPNCQNIMKQVKVPSINIGYLILIEQCPNCGGLWLDRYEMVQVPHKEAINIDQLDEKSLKKSCPINETLLCPRDNLPLVQLKDINIPADTCISRCRKCEGVWMNRGELRQYKQHVRKRQKETTERPLFKTKVVTDKDGSKMAERKVLSAIGSQLLPLPLSLAAAKTYPKEPFIPSDEGVELLRGVPQDRKVEIYRLMAREHEETEESERRFINATINILNLISRLLVRF
ncbi:MAG TPA: zf-TFIIB domain-containing protein [Patescibacteria group bacterium]|nr:zf-TFIIB domain-containing protein [Patescibacteria group bacterium]